MDEVVETENPVEESPEIVEEVVEEQEYVPSYSYKVLDEEREFDERLKAIVKSKEDEDYIRDIVTRADGLESVKSRLTEREQYIQEVEGKSKALTGGYEKLRNLRDEGNMRELMGALGVDDEKVLEYALALAKEQELPEEQKTLIHNNRELERKAAEYEAQLRNHQEDQKQAAIQRDLAELDSLVSSDEFADVASAFKERGKDFSERVVERGRHLYLLRGEEPSIRSVVEDVAAEMRAFLPQQQQNPEESAPKPVIPGVKSAGTTAVDKPIASLYELRKLAAEVPTGR